MTRRAVMRTHVARSADPIVLLPTTDEQPEPGTYTKPKGFWYEVNGDWRRWARGEDFSIGKYIHLVDVADCNILRIATVDALDAFHARYSVNLEWRTRSEGIDWREVASQYDGIEIAPYQWTRRLSNVVDWYTYRLLTDDERAEVRQKLDAEALRREDADRASFERISALHPDWVPSSSKAGQNQ